jgi:hypothetical protein
MKNTKTEILFSVIFKKDLMPLLISTDTIKEIADQLESGIKCFYHLPTGNLEYYPDELGGHAGFDEEPWQDSMDKVENNYHEYLRFEAMDTHESFRMMETFINDIPEENIRQRFEDAIGYKKPFQNFKQLLLNYPELRLQWFAFKTQKYIEWVQEQIDAYRSSSTTDEEA